MKKTKSRRKSDDGESPQLKPRNIQIYLTEKNEAPIEAMTGTELPPEFKKFDKPLGIFEQYQWNLMWIGLGHLCFFYYALYLLPFGVIPRMTFVGLYLYSYIASLGISVGCHRYWTHKAFKANMPFQVILMLLQTTTFQYPIFKWSRDHRVHHKYMDTDADPHNSHRGFWFSHITWLFQKPHPEYLKALKVIDISDLAKDPLVRFQSRHYWLLVFIFLGIVPMAIFKFFFPTLSLFHLTVIAFTRYIATLHGTFFVNSLAHMWGDKPFDKYISATDSTFVGMITVGEGWHNYHHTFPWDYKAPDLGFKFGFKYNLALLFIQFFAAIGWAWDLKTTSHKMLRERINRTGDEDHPVYKFSEWGVLESEQNDAKQIVDQEKNLVWDRAKLR